uniref:carboxylesterase n=1 Tax=Anopheles epiroticus TaxID=199890 RepID=A0A182PNE9_9DIPT
MGSCAAMKLLVTIGALLVLSVSGQLKLPRVCTDDGCLLGASMTDTKNLKFDAFVGIPYAKPPVGKLRFKKPIPVEPWTEDYNATESKPACLQKSFLQPGQPIVGDENCLYLNVYRPKHTNDTAAAAPLPVMVFLHGGGYFFGSADPQLYGPERILATKQVILVTLQYRLGVFGFLSTGDGQATGNYGMLDQVLALRWVKRHIGAFGGDPQSVTLFGESAGGASVQLHMMSPLSQGLFQRAIIMSGSALAVWSLPIEDPLSLARRQAKLVGVSEADELTTAELVDVLQYLDAKVLAASMPHLRTWFEHPIIMYRPTIQDAFVPSEERFLTDDPRKLWAEGRYADIPIMVGTVPNEGAVVSLAIVHNETLVQEFNANLKELLTPILAINATPAVVEKLKGRYFSQSPNDRWITEDSAEQFTKMMSDAFIKYPTMKTLLEYNNANRTSCRDTTLYSFEFAGRHSFSSLYIQSNASHGVCHQDELPYIFRMIDLFPDFPPDSPEEEMCNVWTEFFVNFASNRTHREASSESCENNIRTVTFGNAQTSQDGAPASSSAVLVSSGKGINEELESVHEFWSDVYRTSCLGGVEAYQTEPVVCIADGCLRGTVMQSSVGISYPAFLGVPFAKPPIGKLRFANPQPNDPWQGKYDATKTKDACIQKVSLVPTAPLFGTEDCLYLNVFIPALEVRDADLLPVMVYIHGGGFLYGSAQIEQRDPARFMSSRKVIVVTFQYRLGVFGFLSTGDTSASGNFGMKDQVLVLRWVQKNIRAFGGDPKRVTIFGESAGGSSVQFQMLSPLSRGLFHRAISMSGSAISSWSVPIENPLALTRAQASVLGIPDAAELSTEQLVEQLREVDAIELTSSIERLKLWDIHPITLYHPVVEPQEEPEPFLAEDPRDAWRRGAYAKVPWMTGSIPNDGSIVTQTIYRNDTLVEEFNAKFVKLLPLILGTNVTKDKLVRLRRRFLKNTPPTKWVTKDNYDEITKLMSEAWFLYPMVKSLKQHLSNRRYTSTSVYSFQFRGRYSFSKLFTGTDTPYGLSHPDEIIYLFRGPLFFPEFPPRSPEAEMAQLWVKFFVHFATHESVDKEGTCFGDKCEVVTFDNTNNSYFPVSKRLVPGLDEEMYSFWRSFFDEKL